MPENAGRQQHTTPGKRMDNFQEIVFQVRHTPHARRSPAQPSLYQCSRHGPDCPEQRNATQSKGPILTHRPCAAWLFRPALTAAAAAPAQISNASGKPRTTKQKMSISDARHILLETEVDKHTSYAALLQERNPTASLR